MLCTFFKKWAIPGLFFLYFRLFNTQLTVYKCSILINFCQWLDSNRGPLVSEATALPTEPQPLPMFYLFTDWTLNLRSWVTQANVDEVFSKTGSPVFSVNKFGDLWNLLVPNFLTILTQIKDDYLGHFEKHPFSNKISLATFWATFGTLGYF